MCKSKRQVIHPFLWILVDLDGFKGLTIPDIILQLATVLLMLAVIAKEEPQSIFERFAGARHSVMSLS